MKEDADLFRHVSASHFQFFSVWFLIGWALIATIVYLSLTSSPPEILEFSSGDKVKHFVAYGVLMGWFTQVYSARRPQIFWAVTFCLLGIILEFVQGWTGYRFFDVADMIANSFGVLLGWWVSRQWLAGSLMRVDSALSRLLRAPK